MQFIGRRVAVWCAVLAMAVALVAITVGCGDAQATEPEQAPIVLSATLSAPTPFTPRVLSLAEWRATVPRRIATVEEAETALIEAGMPPVEASVLASIAANCEAPKRDRDGTSIGIDLNARGDADGRSQGAFQVNTVAHPWSRDLYLADLDVSAQAAVRIFRAQGLSAWSCSR